MSLKPFGWAMIGCGSIAHTVGRELTKSGCGKVVAAYSRTKAHAEQFVARFGGQAFDTLEQAISAEGVEGAYIAVPHNLHAEFARRCLRRGVPVLCEKPLAVNYAEAEQLFRYAREQDVYLSEAMWTWHNPVSLAVRDWVKERRCGDILSVRARYAYPIIRMSRNPRLTSPALAGGALLDIGVYPVRYLYELFGEPASIECRGNVDYVDFGEKIEFGYGTFRAKIDVSIQKLRGEKLVIKGREGQIIVPSFHAAKSAHFIARDGREERVSGEKLLYAVEMRQVADEIRKGMKEGLCCPAQATLDTMHLLDECRRELKIVYPFER